MRTGVESVVPRVGARLSPAFSALRENASAQDRDLAQQFSSALFQGLKAKLPAMELDAVLIDVTCDLSPLRFIFSQAALQIRDTAIRLERGIFLVCARSQLRYGDR